MTAKDIKDFADLFNVRLYMIIAISIFVFCIYNIEKIYLLKASLFGLVSKLFTWAKKGQLSNQLRGTVLKTIKENKLSLGDIISPDLKIEWINEQQPETFVDKEQVIVRIKQSSNPNENLISVVSEYINHGLLYDVKRYLDKDIMTASQLLMTRKIVQNSNKTALPYMDEKYTIPKLSSNNILKENFNRLKKIDDNGMFIGILLNEFHKAGLSIYGEIEDPELVAESSEFCRFLYDIAKGCSTDPQRLNFNRDYFKVSIFLAANNNTLHRNGINLYLKAIKKQLNNGIETIYIFGLGHKRDVAKIISDEVTKDLRITKITKHAYRHLNDSGTRISGVFFECSVYKEKEEI